jgi:hypothetical protein
MEKKCTLLARMRSTYGLRCRIKNSAGNPDLTSGKMCYVYATCTPFWLSSETDGCFEGLGEKVDYYPSTFIKIPMKTQNE